MESCREAGFGTLKPDGDNSCCADGFDGVKSDEFAGSDAERILPPLPPSDLLQRVC